MDNIITNSPRAIFRATRIQTLPGAAVPVMIALSLAIADGGWEQFRVLPALLCILFALLMQIDANFVNDYVDCIKGRDDDERLGPLRACAQGWITLPFMRGLIVLTTLTAAAVGLPLAWIGGWEMILVGVLCIVGCVLYTTHLSRWAMGDVMVLVFFGLIPVCFTYYLQTGAVTVPVITGALACGIEIDSMLIINNFRDHYQDEKHGKRTLSVLVGRDMMLSIFRFLPYVVCALGMAYALYDYPLAFFLPALIYLPAYSRVYTHIAAIHQGTALNQQLAANGRVILLYGILVSGGVLLRLIL